MTILPIQAQVTKTASFVGSGVDVSGITGDWTLKIAVAALSASATCRIEADDSVNDFTASIAGPVISLAGQLSSTADVVLSFKKKDFPDLRPGTTSASLRTQVSRISAGASITYSSWLEY